MGYKLYREIRDRAPADWTPAERLVALMIADDASDLTRQSWIKLPVLMERAGIKSESGVRQALQRLAARGFEFRVPVGKGRDGRLVFATKGHSLDYLVPQIPQRRLPAVAFDEEPESGPPADPKATVTDAKGDCAESPLSSTPLLKDQKMASRRGAASGSAAPWTDQDKIRNTRTALADAYGADINGTISDEEVLALYEWKAPRGRRVASITKYMGRIFECCPDFGTLHSQLDNEMTWPDSGGSDPAAEQASAIRKKIINDEPLTWECARCHHGFEGLSQMAATGVCIWCDDELKRGSNENRRPAA